MNRLKATIREIPDWPEKDEPEFRFSALLCAESYGLPIRRPSKMCMDCIQASLHFFTPPTFKSKLQNFSA